MTDHPLPFEYQVRARTLQELSDDDRVAALESRDRQLEDHLADLARQIADIVAQLP